MKTTIPQKTIVTCDFCKKTNNNGGFKMETVLEIRRHALDMYGDAAASGDCRFDCCDACSCKIVAMLNEIHTKT